MEEDRGWLILCIFMAGCGSQNEVYLETEVSQDTGNVQETKETEAGGVWIYWTFPAGSRREVWICRRFR